MQFPHNDPREDVGVSGDFPVQLYRCTFLISQLAVYCVYSAARLFMCHVLLQIHEPDTYDLLRTSRILIASLSDMPNFLVTC